MSGVIQDQPESEISSERGTKALIDGLDYYIDVESGAFVMTGYFLLQVGQCCGNGCRHCPYLPKHGGKSARPAPLLEARPSQTCIKKS